MILDPDVHPVGIDSPLILTFATRLVESTSQPVLLIYRQPDTLKYLERRFTLDPRIKVVHALASPPFRPRAHTVILAPVSLKAAAYISARYTPGSRSLFIFSPGEFINV